MARSRRHAENLNKLEKGKTYTILEALGLLKAFKKCKFNETVEIAMKLGIDPKKSDQLLRGSVGLPAGTGKDVSVICFAEGDMAEQARAAGALEAGGEELAKKVLGGWLDFDIAIAHPSMMKHVGKLGKVLGPQGKMPSPKAGTITPDVVQTVREFKAGKIEYRTDDGGTVHGIVGKVDFKDEALEQNIRAFIDHIQASRPSSVKGQFIQSIVISSTMSPGIPIAG